ncbi:hypothetical protein B7494_g3050 [Chlorociboria aeruginascens]|nr:hypothetical protein B7494_g3050 [Chlorociboria aeruginascens]
MTASLLSMISELFGWIYTISWSLSFYPQPILNFRRRSTTGTTIDFPSTNVLGFVAYFVSNAAFLWSPIIRQQYALRNHGLMPTVQFNDFAFAAHAVVLSALTASQFVPSIWGFERRGNGAGARISRWILGILVGSLIAVGFVGFIVIVRHDPDPMTGWAGIDVVYAVSYIKVLVTLIKYMPQVATNYRNQSTHGWSIAQILFDIVNIDIFSMGVKWRRIEEVRGNFHLLDNELAWGTR